MPKATFLAKKLAGEISKDEFLTQLTEQWAPLISRSSDIDKEVKTAQKRIQSSGFAEVFAKVGVTEEDLRFTLQTIIDKKKTAYDESTKGGIRTQTTFIVCKYCGDGGNKEFGLLVGLGNKEYAHRACHEARYTSKNNITATEGVKGDGMRGSK